MTACVWFYWLEMYGYSASVHVCYVLCKYYHGLNFAQCNLWYLINGVLRSKQVTMNVSSSGKETGNHA